MTNSPLPRAVLAAGFVTVLALTACSSGGSHPQPHDPSSLLGSSSPSALPRTTSTPQPLPSGVLAKAHVLTGNAPSEMVAAGGAIWVQGHRAQSVSRLDPRTDRVTANVTTNENGCGQPLAVDGEVWVQPCDDTTSTVVIDTATATVRGTVKNAGGATMAAAAGSVWVSSYQETHLLRVDPSTLKVTATLDVPSGLVVYGDGKIWSAGISSDSGTSDGRLVEIDPRDDHVVGRYPIPKLHDMYGVFAFGKIWLKSDDNPMLVRFDPRTHRASSTRLAGWKVLDQYTDQPIDAAAGALWIRVSPGHVARIDPTTRRVTATYPADVAGGGGSPLVAFGSLWVSNFASDTVWRDRLPS